MSTNEKPAKADVEVVCLHCTLLAAYEAWHDDYEAKVGEPPTLATVGAQLGGFIGEMTSIACEAVDGDKEEMTAFAEAVMQGQVSQKRAEDEAAAAEAAEPVEADPNTRH